MSFGSRMDDHKEKLDVAKDQLDRVEYCIEHGSECNQWEDDFLENIKDWLMRGQPLSDAQNETLEKIEYLVEWGRESYWEEYGRGDR